MKRVSESRSYSIRLDYLLTTAHLTKAREPAPPSLLLLAASVSGCAACASESYIVLFPRAHHPTLASKLKTT